MNDVVQRTTIEYVPWHLIKASDKSHARAASSKIVQTFRKALQKRLKV